MKRLYLTNTQNAVRGLSPFVRLATLHLMDGLKLFEYSVRMSLVNNRTIQYYNKRDRGFDKPTDVLSYPLIEAEKPGKLVRPRFLFEHNRELGIVLISVPYVASQCKREGWSLQERFELVLAHSLCHLLGYDHETTEQFRVMRRAEERALRYMRPLVPRDMVEQAMRRYKQKRPED